jgi:hypothetical protein
MLMAITMEKDRAENLPPNIQLEIAEDHIKY